MPTVGCAFVVYDKIKGKIFRKYAVALGCLLLINYFFQVSKPRDCRGPTGVKCDMRNRRHKFFPREAVFEGLFKMNIDLLDTVQSNQACDSY
jgi:hypothetical protein